MAAFRAVTVGVGGAYNYTALNTAFATEDDTYANLTAQGGWLDFVCYAGTGADTTGVNTGAGWTTDATHYLNVYGAPSEQVAGETGKWSTSRYRVVAAVDGQVFSVDENYTAIADLQLNNTYSTAGDHNPGLIDGGGTSVTVQNLVAYGVVNGSDYPFGVRLRAASVLRNAIIYNVRNSTTSRGIGVARAAGAGPKCYNVTVSNCHVGFDTPDDGQSQANQLLVINCLASGCANGFEAGWQWGTGSDYNASDLASDAPGSHSRNSQTFTFAGSGDYHLAGTDAGALGYGVGPALDASVPTADIDGDARSGNACDIGADEYVAEEEEGLAIPVAMYHYQHH